MGAVKKLAVKWLHDWVRVRPGDVTDLLLPEGLSKEVLEQLREELEGFEHGPAIGAGVVVEHGYGTKAVKPDRIVLFVTGAAVPYAAETVCEDGRVAQAREVLVPESAILAIIRLEDSP